MGRNDERDQGKRKRARTKAVKLSGRGRREEVHDEG